MKINTTSFPKNPAVVVTSLGIVTLIALAAIYCWRNSPSSIPPLNVPPSSEPKTSAFAENNQTVFAKIDKARQNGQKVILIVGRTPFQSRPTSTDSLWVSLDDFNLGSSAVPSSLIPEHKQAYKERNLHLYPDHLHLVIDFNKDELNQIKGKFDEIIFCQATYKFFERDQEAFYDLMEENQSLYISQKDVLSHDAFWKDKYALDLVFNLLKDQPKPLNDDSCNYPTYADAYRRFNSQSPARKRVEEKMFEVLKGHSKFRQIRQVKEYKYPGHPEKDMASVFVFTR